MGRELSSLEVCVHPPKPPEPEVEPPNDLIVPIARRLELSFDGRASGTQQVVPIAYGVDVSPWVSGTFVFILHARNAWLTSGGANTTALVNVVVESVSLDPDAPESQFIDTSRQVAASPTITATTGAPLYVSSAFTTPFGPQLRVTARFSQGISPAGGPQTLAVSIFLVGRRA